MILPLLRIIRLDVVRHDGLVNRPSESIVADIPAHVLIRLVPLPVAPETDTMIPPLSRT